MVQNLVRNVQTKKQAFCQVVCVCFFKNAWFCAFEEIVNSTK